MTMIYQHSLSDGVVALMEIDRLDDFYLSHLDLTDGDNRELGLIQHSKRRLQWLASRYLLKTTSNQNRTLYLQKSELGKPSFTNHNAHFSISHSREYVALIYSESQKVAIDIEVIQPKIQAIRSKFIHPNDYEQGEDILNLTIIWSAKETIYKYFDTRAIYSFKKHIAIIARNGNSLKAEVEINNEFIQFELSYKIFEKIVMVWIVRN
jgi:4'-phosphopantetheinyl transferase